MAAMPADSGNAAGSASEHLAQTAGGQSKKEYQSLKELTQQSAGIGMWLLQVAEAPRDWEYTYTFNGHKCTGRRFEAILVSPDASVYCIGAFRRKQDNAAGNKKFADALSMFQHGTVWEASKISLAKEKPCFISSPLKLMIDLNASKMTPVLQSTYKMPSEATPVDTLHTILMCPENQRVDVTALLHDISSRRSANTARGERYIFDVTIRDDSGPENGSESSFTVSLSKKPEIAERA